MNRRWFLKKIGCISGAAALAGSGNAQASQLRVTEEQVGVLVDTTLCVGCRSCEKACNTINEDLPRKPAEFFKDESMLDQRRRMDCTEYTVVNRYTNPRDAGSPVYAKFQCMHCLYPACVSACLVKALTRKSNGPVVYESWNCIGCRYCMAACPFQVPAYEYGNVLTPQVRKCTFCFDTRISKGGIPACVSSCPMQVMTFGRRPDLIRVARERIRKNPGRYVPHIYGENEVGGTAWMYLSSIPFAELDFPRLGYHPTPGYTEPIQHAIFKWFLPPLGLCATLGGVMWYMKNRKTEE
jgi:formate dehydrogenase iron-sulfur subunit